MKTQIFALFAIALIGLACASGAQQSLSQSIPQAPAATVRESPIKAGDTAPDFTLQDQKGSKVTLSAARGQSPVVLVFYRGYW